MNRKIKIIKRAVEDFTQGEPQTNTPEHFRDNAKIDSPIQIARTVQEWVRETPPEGERSVVSGSII